MGCSCVPVCRGDVAELATLINLTCSDTILLPLYDPHLSHLHPLTPQTHFRDSKKINTSQKKLKVIKFCKFCINDIEIKHEIAIFQCDILPILRSVFWTQNVGFLLKNQLKKMVPLKFWTIF